MLINRLYALAAAFALVVFMLTGVASAATDKNADDPASKFVQSLGDKALSSLTDKSIDFSTRQKRVRSLLTQYFDVPTIARFAAAGNWKQATAAQQKEYMTLFEDMVVFTYAKRFADYSGQSLKVQGANTVDERDSLVNSQIIQKDGPPVNVQWRVRSKAGSMKIIDVVVESISMSVTQRSDFKSVIQSGGGDFEALLVSLRSKQGK